MRLRTFCLSVLIFLTFSIHAGAGVAFVKRLALSYSQVSCGIQASDGGVLLSGRMSTSHYGISGILFLRFDNNGRLLWKRIYTIEGGAYPYAMIQMNDGGFAITGTAMREWGDSGGFFPQVFIMKINSSGALVWKKLIATGDRWDDAYGISVVDQNSFVIVGSTSNDLVSEGLIARVSNTGNLIWAHKVRPDSHSIYGYSVYFRRVQTLADGRIVALGVVNYAPVLTWFSKDGTVLNTKSYRPYGMSVDYGDLAQSADGSIVLAGHFQNQQGDGLMLSNLKADGSPKWHHSYIISAYTQINRLAIVPDGFLIAGSSSDSQEAAALILKTDTSGKMVLQIKFGADPEEFGEFVGQTSDGKLFLAGSSLDFENDIQNAYLLKIDPATSNTNCSLVKSFPVKTTPTPKVRTQTLLLKTDVLDFQFIVPVVTSPAASVPIHNGCAGY